MAEKTLENRRMVSGRGGQRNTGRGSMHSDGHKPNQRRNKSRAQQRNHTPKHLFKIETTHFLSVFHSEICRAAKYKVHAPLCTCSKIDKLRQLYRKEKDMNDNRNLSERLKDLDVSDPFDNLLVVPDTKTTPAMFVCNQTTSIEFQNDATVCENKIATKIFDNTDMTSLDKFPFKVSCALCLLDHQRNGFVAIVADSVQELEPTIAKAKACKAAKKTTSHNLHSDHAHFICAVQLSSLKALVRSAKTRAKHSQIVSEILSQLKNGGIDLPPSDNSTIKLGHHLTSFIWLEGTSKGSKRGYIMVLGYIDGPYELMLDLPGGKRHLGESTLESLVREVEEETSLELDKQWLAERLSRRYGGALDENSEDIQVLETARENGNVYFVIPPIN
ncbi:hypothetical protein ACHAWT_005080 [Skeletonema menzelii]